MIYVDPEKIGERLKEQRKKQGMTQSDLTKLTGIAETQISGYENGKRNCELETLCNLAMNLNTDLTYLVFGKEGTIVPKIKETSREQRIIHAFETLFLEGYLKYNDSADNNSLSILFDKATMKEYIETLNNLCNLKNTISDDTIQSGINDAKKKVKEKMINNLEKRELTENIAYLSRSLDFFGNND